MNFFKKNFPLFVVLFLFAGTTFAQGQQQMMQQQIQPLPPDSVSDTDLQVIVDVNRELRPFVMQSQQEMQTIIEDNEDITLQRFQVIMQARSSGQTQNIQITEEEQQAIQTLQPKLLQLNQQITQKEQELVNQSDMDMQRYQRVAITIQSNEEVRKRFQSAMMDTAGTGEDGGNDGDNR